MIPERERVALMRLTMCAREDCVMCEHKEQCNFDFQYDLATKNMNILADALRKTEPTISKMEQVDKDINVRSKDEPQISPADCATCKHDLWSTPRTCGKCARQKDGKPSMYEPKDEPQTDVYEYHNGEWVKPDCAWK